MYKRCTANDVDFLVSQVLRCCHY